MTLNKELLEVLACPKCKGDVNEDGLFMVCAKCSLAYPVAENVPDMLVEDAWPLEKAKKAGFKHTIKL